MRDMLEERRMIPVGLVSGETRLSTFEIDEN